MIVLFLTVILAAEKPLDEMVLFSTPMAEPTTFSK